MAETQTSICNQALSLIGAHNITAYGDGSYNADSCALFWDQCIEDLLADYDWKFAIARDTLGIDSVTPAFEYDYQWQIHATCLRILEVYNYVGDWEVEGSKLLCHLGSDDTCYIKFIRTGIGISGWSRQFIEGLIIRLGKKLVSKIKNSQGSAIDFQKLEDVLVARAKRLDAIEEGKHKDQKEEARSQNNEWVTAGR